MQNAAVAAGTGILEGVIGIVKQPILGGKQEGAKGVFKGIGRGLVGLFAKPAAGLTNAVGNVGVAVEVCARGATKDIIIV